MHLGAPDDRKSAAKAKLLAAKETEIGGDQKEGLLLLWVGTAASSWLRKSTSLMELNIQLKYFISLLIIYI